MNQSYNDLFFLLDRIINDFLALVIIPLVFIAIISIGKFGIYSSEKKKIFFLLLYLVF